MNFGEYQFRLATPHDGFAIMELYQEVYSGTYPDPLMNQYSQLKDFLHQPNNFWFVSEKIQSDRSSELVASVVLKYGPDNKIAKAFGAVVKPKDRGGRMMDSLLEFGMKKVKEQSGGLEIVYATTRTVHAAAQALTERLGFKKLGIFPNSRKTSEYETHCLTAFYYPETIEKRFTQYKLHERLRGMVALTASEIPELKSLEYIYPEKPSRQFMVPPVLEMIDTEHFVRFRYEHLKETHQLQFTFFPFHKPNVLILSPDQSIEVFCHLSPVDEHSVIIGVKVPDDIDFTKLFDSIATNLRDHGARYVELLIRADKPKIIESVMNAKFIPSAFFPAFQFMHEMRHDYVVLSRTYEVFDFQNIRLQGLNQEYLEEYFKQWQETAIPRQFIPEN